MNIKKAFIAFIVPMMLIGQMSIDVSATAGTEPLQTYFASDGKTLKIFTSEPLADNASILIGNETLEASVQNSGVQVNTIFLIDNSTSMPYSLRNEVKTAIADYVSVMPETESVKVAMFDTQTTILADEYSNDREFINYELSKVDFNGQASLVYDAVMNVIDSSDTNQDIYYRTVLITDGVDSIEGTSFDYLRSAISDNGRYHIDVVQVSEGSKQDVNLTAISNLGSNTYTLFNSGVKFDTLIPENVSLMKVNLINEVTTGELKGVTIKNGDSNISLGSIMFPQVEIAPPETTMVEQTAVTTTEAEETTEATTSESTTEATANDKKDSGSSPLFILLIAIGGYILVGAAVAVFFILRKKKSLNCNVSVQVKKDDERDKNGIGMDVWAFPITSEFRVGRTLEPVSSDKTPLPKNHRAICENATNEDISSIGRNAFALTYDSKTNTVTIKNIAKGAMFSVETAGKRVDVKSGQSAVVMNGSKILLGNYTTVIIHNITVNNS